MTHIYLVYAMISTIHIETSYGIFEILCYLKSLTQGSLNEIQISLKNRFHFGSILSLFISRAMISMCRCQVIPEF